MAAVLEPQRETLTEQDELAAVEQLARALCEQVARLIDTARSDDRLGTREARLQLAAFEERRQRALSVLDAPSGEPTSIRLGNLEKIAEALECSRAFFGTSANSEPVQASASSWSVRVR